MNGLVYALSRDGGPLTNSSASRFHVVEMSLENMLDVEPLDTGSIRTVTAVTVVKLVGRASLGLNGCDVPVRAGDEREGLDVTSLDISTDGWPGGAITLEIHGRP